MESGVLFCLLNITMSIILWISLYCVFFFRTCTLTISKSLMNILNCIFINYIVGFESFIGLVSYGFDLLTIKDIEYVWSTIILASAFRFARFPEISDSLQPDNKCCGKNRGQ